MKCTHCGKNHDASLHHAKMASKLSDKGFPTHARKYKEAHKDANRAEKKAFGEKSFRELEKIDSRLGKHELIGKNLKSGKIEISKKVPEKLRKEVAYHEKVENKILRKKK